MGYNQSIDSSYMFMPSYDFGMYGLNNPAAYNYCAYTNPSIYSGGFNPMFGYNNYMTPTLPFTFNGLSTTKSTPTLSGTDLSAVSSNRTTPTELTTSALNTPEAEPEEKEGRSTWGKIGIGLLVTAAVVGIGLFVDHRWNGGKVKKAVGDWFKGLGKAKPETEKPKPDVPPVSPSQTASKFKDMTPEQISEYLKSADKNKGEYHEALEQLFKKSNSIEDGEKLIKYYDDIMNGQIKFKNPEPLSREAILMDSHDDWCMMKLRKADVYADMSHIYKKANNYDKALEMMTNTYTLTECPSAAAEMAKLHALKGNSNEGLKLTLSELEKMQNDAFNDEQVFLFDGIKECLEKAGNTELSRSIELLKKGSYTFDKLTPEEIKFLTEKGIDYKKICGEGGREQTGAMAKWVCEQVRPLLSA